MNRSKKSKTLEEKMDIFSATSKQVESVTTPKVAQTTAPRQVEQTSEIEKTNKEFQESEIKTLKETVKDLNNLMEMLDTNVTFGFNDKISLLFVSVMEKSTGKMIRKIPTEEAMDLSEKMKEIVGMIFDKKG